MSKASALAATAGCAALTLLLSPPAGAAWSKAGVGAGAAKAMSMAAPRTVTVAPASTTSMKVDATAPASGPTPTSYRTDRTTPSPSNGRCSSLPCTDTGRTAGTAYTYRVLPQIGSWILPTAGATAVAATTPTTALFATDVDFTNGSAGTATLPEAGDTIAIRMSANPTQASICTGWSSGTLTGLTVTMTRGNGGKTNDLAIARSACSGGLHVGAFVASTNVYVPTNNTPVWTSTLSLSGPVLTITLGACAPISDCAAVVSGTGMTYRFDPDAGMKSSSGVAASGTASVWGELF